MHSIDESKLRIIQELVPGKQVSIAHLIANPDISLYNSLNIKQFKAGAIGLLTITPAEAAIIAADIAVKSSGVSISFIDRENGTLIITGSVSEAEAALNAITDYLREKMDFSVCELTKT